MSNRYDPKDELQSIAGEISDHAEVDWERARAHAPRLAGTVEGLRLIERVAEAHRSAQGEYDPAPADSNAPLFSWGELQVLAKIGEGGYAEVYRAWDSKLRRHVALKLRKIEASASSSSRWMEEARRLADVRHPNVLVIHGAAVHEGRAGIWTDLIQGSTLSDWVREQGPLGAREAAIVVMDVCLALSAVHGRGLVHGDVKASNVMRESGGRLVLMDFGSGQRLKDPAGASHSGTPLVSAPELLEGAPASIQSDVYSLGVLLYWLVSGAYPVEADSLEELREHLQAGESVPLRERRPELPSAFVRIVERALAQDPTARWNGPSELESALAALLAGDRAASPSSTAAHTASKRRAPRRWAAVTLFALVLVVAFVSWMLRRPILEQGQEPSPYEQLVIAGSELSVEAGILQVTDAGVHPLAPGSSLAPGMRLALEMSCSEPAHVYVLNEDDQGELFVLFPLDGVDLANPLEGGHRYQLPGQRDGRQQSWVVTSRGGIERFMAVVSRDPLPELEQAIAEFRRASVDRSVTTTAPSKALSDQLRGVGGMADAATRTASGGDVLERIANSLVTSSADPDELWIWRASFSNPAAETR